MIDGDKMIDWDVIKAMGAFYIGISIPITIIAYSISLMTSLDFSGFFAPALFLSGVYWLATILTAFLE